MKHVETATSAEELAAAFNAQPGGVYPSYTHDRW